MRSETFARLRWAAIGLAVTCVWFDFNLRETPRPQLACYDWRRTVDGWEEAPRWQAPPTETFARPLIFASLVFGASAVALSAWPQAWREGRDAPSAGGSAKNSAPPLGGVIAVVSSSPVGR